MSVDTKVHICRIYCVIAINAGYGYEYVEQINNGNVREKFVAND